MLTLRDTTTMMLLELAAGVPEATEIGKPLIGSNAKPDAVPDVARRCR